MGEESEEDSKFEIHTVKLPRTIHRTPSPEKKFLDPCNNMERLEILIKKFVVFIIYFIFLVSKIKGRSNLKNVDHL